MSEGQKVANQNFGDSSYLDALVVASCVVGALIALVVLRFLVNYLIDVVIIGESGCMSTWMGGICRRLCPCWHRRTQPDESSTDRANVQDVETGAAFRRRPQEERKAIIANILPTKTFSSDDIEGIKQTLRKLDTSSTCDIDDASESGNCVCSICLLDFEIGDHIVTAEKCAHSYHKHCIVEWLSSHDGMHCPYCRTPMVSMESIRVASAESDCINS